MRGSSPPQRGRRTLPASKAKVPARRSRPVEPSDARRRPERGGIEERAVRRSLTHVGGGTKVMGDGALGEILVKALEVPSSLEDGGEALARAHVHGFHTYPARLHPATARWLVASLSEPGQVVLDPFCGSGTVLVEARLLGRKAVGTDINPLALRLADLKVTPHGKAFADILLEASLHVSETANQRRKARSGASRRYPPEDVAIFDSHVLLELDGIRVGIESFPRGELRSVLELLLSSILVKLSKKVSDTVSHQSQVRTTRIAAGFPTRVFVRKAEELANILATIAPELEKGPPARLTLDDARTLSSVPERSIDLIVSSPPYAYVYDYVEHHALRLRWLGLHDEGFRRAELLPRRSAARFRPEEAVGHFREEMVRVLRAIERVLAEGGRAVLVIADSAIGSTPLRALSTLREIADVAGLVVLSAASQSRPHFHERTQRAFADGARDEHAIVLGRAPRRKPRT